jgi:hypothetical protein
VPAGPLKVGNPLIADTLQLPLEDWSVSRLIHYSIAVAFEFVLPHRHDDSFSIAADSGQTEVPMRRNRAKVRKARR